MDLHQGSGADESAKNTSPLLGSPIDETKPPRSFPLSLVQRATSSLRSIGKDDKTPSGGSWSGDTSPITSLGRERSTTDGDSTSKRRGYRFRLKEEDRQKDVERFISSHSRGIAEGSPKGVDPTHAQVWFKTAATVSPTQSGSGFVNSSPTSPHGRGGNTATGQGFPDGRATTSASNTQPQGTNGMHVNATKNDSEGGGEQRKVRRPGKRTSASHVAVLSSYLDDEEDEEDAEYANERNGAAPLIGKESKLGMSGNGAPAENTYGGSNIAQPTAEQNEALRKRLIEDDFFSDPIHKLRRDGRFPYKLALSLLTFFLILVHVIFFQVKDTQSDELQRRVMIGHFTGDAEYQSKSNGDMVDYPHTRVSTREEVTKLIRNFVEVYYSISEMSVSDLNFYVDPNEIDGLNFSGKQVHRDLSSRGRMARGSGEVASDSNDKDDDDDDDRANKTLIAPVMMVVNLFPYNRRERSLTTVKKVMEFQLTLDNVDDILAPFYLDDDDDNNDTDSSSSSSSSGNESDSAPVVSSSALRAICSPRLDEITGMYYLPCRDAVEPSDDSSFSATGTKNKNKKDKTIKKRALWGSAKNTDDDDDDSSNASSYDYFTLVDNVLAITLRVSLRHLSDNMNDLNDPSSSPFRASIFHWDVEKRLKFSSGGLVDVDVDVSVTSLNLSPRVHASLFIITALLIASIAEIPFRICALQRILRYKRKLHYERDQFLLAIGAKKDGTYDPLSAQDSGKKKPIGKKISSALHLSMDGSQRSASEVYYLPNDADRSFTDDMLHALIDGGGAVASSRPTVADSTRPWISPGYGHASNTNSARSMNTIGGSSAASLSSSHAHAGAGKSIFEKLRELIFGSDSEEIPEDAASMLKVGTATVETSYRDFADQWRQQLQSSMGMDWNILGLISSFLVIVYCLISLSSAFQFLMYEGLNGVRHLLLGVASMLNCILLLSYLRYFPRIYFVVRATRQVLPQLARFFFTISPLYLSFVLFYYISFGPHSNGEFTTFKTAVTCMFFIMYGDAIIPGIANAANSHFPIVVFLANLMTVIFLFMFMMTMLNVAMAITQQEWSSLRRRFGACLSVNNILFTVRSRNEVRQEAVETIVTNLELLLYLRKDELEAEAQLVYEHENFCGHNVDGSCNVNHAQNISGFHREGDSPIGGPPSIAETMSHGENGRGDHALGSNQPPPHPFSTIVHQQLADLTDRLPDDVI